MNHGRGFEVYELVDPRNGEPRYVGVTVNGRHKRLKSHIRRARRGGLSYRDNWIRELLSLGMTPTCVLLEEGHGDEWSDRERFWVALRKERYALTNHTEGGEGTIGYRHKTDARDKMSAAHAGRVITDEARANMAASQKGRKASNETIEKKRSFRHSEETRQEMRRRKHSPETLEMLSKAAKTRPPISEETRAKISLAARNRSDETRAKMSTSQKAKAPISDETRAKMSAARKGHVKSPETRAKLSSALMGHGFSDETRAKMSAAQKRRYENKKQ